MSTIDTSTWNPDPALNESIGDILLNESASIKQTWQAIQMLMAAGGLHGLQLVTFDGATASADGKRGLVPAPEAGDQDKFLKGDGTWDAISSSQIPSLPSSKITPMTGYSKPSSTSAIAATDSLNSAIGKLEKDNEYLAGEILLVDAVAANGVAIASANQLLISDLEARVAALEALHA